MADDSTRSRRSLLVALVATALYLATSALCMLADNFYVLLLPLVALLVLFFVCRLEVALLSVALLTPFAVNAELMPGMQLSIPVEPMMILFSAVFLFRVLVDKTYDRRILRHPVSIAVGLSLVWFLVTACFSSMPGVSLKYFVVRLWFVLPFYYAAVQIFSDPRRRWQLVLCYAVGLVCVVVIATAKTVGNFSDLQTLHRVMRPFYNDHTAYGCVLALFVPVLTHFALARGRSMGLRLLSAVLLTAVLVGLAFSYSRAAWISVVGALLVYVLVRLGIKMRWMLAGFVLLLGLFFVHQSDVIYKLGKNQQDSAYDLSGQLKSISNISTDASNLERLNRWASAFRMWREHPVMGCGPGTYQFLYGSYQRSYQLSVISTYAGDLGNAHSEYIGPLTEQGVPGVVLVLCVFGFTFVTGVRVYRTAANPLAGRAALAFAVSLVTYYIHGLFNNFLDTDKLSVPFWAMTAAVVAIDLYTPKRDEAAAEEPSPSHPDEEAA